MNGAPYPRGAARAIAEARTGGLRPAEVVLIVLAGRFDWPNPTVYATPGQRYRWDWLRGLSIVVLIDAGTRLGSTLDDIYNAEPAQLDVIDAERGLGWLVCFTRPRLRTVRWPRGQVADWLGDGHWHRELNALKEQARQQAELQRRMAPTVEVEAVWN